MSQTKVPPPAATVSADTEDPRLTKPGGVGKQISQRLKGGDLGAIPVVIGLAIIVIVFSTLSEAFLTPFNLVNLTLQIAAVGTISVGIVLVLLLGEIDLSVGSVSGLAAAVVVVLNTNQGWNPWLSVLGALVVGALVGLFQGFVFAKIGVPSFVVTLAGLLAWQGLQLWVLGDQGTINLPANGELVRLGQASFLGRTVAYIVVAVVCLAYLGAQLVNAKRRSDAGLSSRPIWAMLLRAGALLVILEFIVYTLNRNRGVATMLVIFLVIVVAFDLILRRTRYGRSIFAVGGNIEAARRAGIRVDRIRISVFVLCSTLAALGGVLAAARLGSASQSSGSGDVLINAIAAAVIGGVSLFGGRGSAYGALLGILVIGSIANGLNLLGIAADARFMITGAVLLLAVVIDALSRRGRASSGRG